MKVSEMMIEVSGDLLKTPANLEEMQAHVELVKRAWNMSLYSNNKRKSKLKRFIDSQTSYAPSVEALKGLEWQFRRIIKQKDTLFPKIRRRIEFAEAIEENKDNYVVRAYFTDASDSN